MTSISNVLFNQQRYYHLLKTLRDLRVTTSALVSEKMEKRKTNIVLEVLDDIITEYLDIKNFIQQKLIEECAR